jgi:hypothetical protein
MNGIAMGRESDNLNALLEVADDEYNRMELSLALYQPRKEVAHWIMQAYTDPAWDWRKSDGCTGVSECHFPKGMRFPPCVMHDYLRWLVKQGVMSVGKCDRLFYQAQVDYRVSRLRSFIRAWFVRYPAWYLWHKWK